MDIYFDALLNASTVIFPWMESFLARTLGLQFWPKEFISYFSKLTDSVMEQKASTPSDHVSKNGVQ